MIRIIFVGKSKDKWLREQIDEYVKRLGAFCRVEVVEVRDEKILGNTEKKVKELEGERILKLVDDDFLIALDSLGKSFESEKFALALKKATHDKAKVAFVVGGALGLSDEVLKRCDLRLSLSKMTFTNQMVRLILVEQIYRAFMIMNGREYHK